jgi:serine protease AprX
MKKLFALAVISFLLVNGLQAQLTRYIVRFKNKGATSFTLANPSAYLSQRAIDRRIRYNIPVDSSDIPVPSSYITQIKNIPNVTLLNVSRWVNAVDIQTSDPNAITSINALPFVQSTSAIAARINDAMGDKFSEEKIADPVTSRVNGTAGDFFNYGAASFNEIHLHKGEFLHNIGMRGQGMLITVLDGGFFHYTSLKAFDSANLNGQIVSTWDFVNRENSVVEDDAHGMMCLSTIVANIPGQFTGKAPKASFHLFRTEEVSSEYPIEEFNWVCGAERADSLGSDVISSSLGYNTFDNASFNHTYSQMNGNTTLCTIGADLAAKKGMIVFNAAGNEGTSSWHYIIAPADGDSVIAVGAVNSSGSVGSFSSYGPSADGRIKPDVASVGVAALVQATNNTIGSSNGTSFATPNMAGLGTCLWQAFPEYNNMRIIRALKEAGSSFNSPNDRIGYGVPDVKQAFATLLTEFAVSSSTIDTCTAIISWTSKDISAMKYEIERKLPGQATYIKIGELTPQPGVVLATRSYQFANTVINPTAGTVSYRIRQIIDTATASFAAVYIDTTNVTIGSSCFANYLVARALSSVNFSNCAATINWSSRDNSTMRYEIERKVPGEASYAKIATIPAQASNTLTVHSYQFNDTLTNTTAGTVSYRVRQIYDTASASFADVYIATIIVGLASPCIDPSTLVDLFKVAPSPTHDNAKLIVQTANAITDMPITVYDMKGRLMFQLKASKAVGKVTINLPSLAWAAGKYFVRIYNGQKLIGSTEFLKL